MEGKRLGAYRIERVLGSGGMGTVYAAVVEGRVPGLVTGDRVALKVVHPHLLGTEGFFLRFLREAQLGASIRHENVVRTYTADALAPHHFLVLEYVEGQTLDELRAEMQRVPEELCRHIGREIAKALVAVHAAGAVHRDLKPENVIISLSAAKPDDDVAERSGRLHSEGTPVREGNVIISLSAAKPDDDVAERPGRLHSEGTPVREGNVRPKYDHVVKLMDLGVARLVDEQLRLSRTGAFVGSLEYAAPEQFRGESEIDHRCDLHALGLVLYELASGRQPFRGDSYHEVMRRVCDETPQRLGEVNPQISPFFEELVHTLLAKAREDRIADAAATLEILEQGEDSSWWRNRARALRDETKRPLRRIRIPRETPVHGREDDLATLRTLFDRARRGDGRVVVIEGEAGIGKSRLVDELVVRLQAAGQDFDFLCGSYPPGGAALSASGFSSAYREHFGEPGSAPYLPQSPLLVPGFDAVLRGEPAPEGSVELTPDSLRTCFVHATRTLAEHRTAVILIEDLHFAPEEARRLFTTVALAARDCRVLLIGTQRPGGPEEWAAHLARMEHVSQLTLDRLGPRDLFDLLKDSFRSERLAEELGMRISVKSDGNPYFAFEIVRGLREGRLITQSADGTWASTGVIDDIEIPSSVLDLVKARVAGLSEDERVLLDVACCWGFEFDPLLVGDVLGVARIPLLRSLSQIERLHRLVHASGRAFVFDHHQVQEALYGSLPLLLREDYHAALAAALEARARAADAEPRTLDGALCADLCDHYLRGARGEEALRYLTAAVDHLDTTYATSQAVELTERALAVPGLLTGSARGHMLVRLSETLGPLDRLGHPERQRECADEAARIAEEADDDRLRGQVARLQGELALREQRFEEAETAFGRAEELAGRAGDVPTRAWSLSGLERVAVNQGRLREAERRIERRLAFARAAGLPKGQGTINLGLVLKAQGRLDEARVHFQTSRTHFRDIGDRVQEAIAITNLGTVDLVREHLVTARGHFSEALQLARACGARFVEATALGNLGSVNLELGCLGEARELTERALDLSREIGSPRTEILALHTSGVVAREEGDLAKAESLFAACLAPGPARATGWLAASARRKLGELQAERGDTDAARASFEEVLELANAEDVAGCAVLARCALAGLSGGDAQDAARRLAAVEDEMRPNERREAHWLLHHATGDPAHLAEARRLLDDALSQVPEEHRDRMRTALRVNRAILAATAGGVPSAGSEAETRVE